MVPRKLFIADSIWLILGTLSLIWVISPSGSPVVEVNPSFKVAS